MLKTKKTIVTKVISFILSMLILFYAVPSVVYSETIDALSSLGGSESVTAENPSSDKADFKLPLYEVEELREESVKHFKLSDGSYVAAQYNYPVHYDDGSGKLLDIDNALSEGSGGVYANKNSRIKFAKKITGNESLFTLHDGNTKITFSLIGAKKGTKGAVTNGKDSKEDTELQKMLNLENLSSSIIYKDILDGVDLEYVAESLNIKENVIVKEKKEEYTYTFEIKLNGLTAALNASGDIEITENGTDEIKYVIPAPVIYDAEGVYAECGIGNYGLTDGGNGKYTLALNVSSEWMNAEERAFPVTVDPTVKLSNSNVVDLTISSSNPDTALHSENYLLVADETIAYWRTTSLPTLPAAAYITSSSITLYTNVFCFNEYVCSYDVVSAWSKTNITWNTHTAATGTKGKLAAAPTDYEVLSSQGAYTWDITPIVRKWYSGTNFGVAFQKAPDLSAAATFHSSESSNTSYAPSLTVSYVGMGGVEDYWSYSSHSIGVAGSGSINLASGFLTLAIPTLSTTDSLMPFTATLVYNSGMANKDYVYGNTDTGNTVDYMPLGFKLNICETVIEKYYTDSAGQASWYYVYADADGTEHSFYQVDQNVEIYYDDSGLQKVLVYNTDDTITITDDSKTTKKFILSPASGADKWYLKEITDKNGNSVIFTFDSSLKPTKVSIKPNGSSQIDFLELYYYSTGKLRMVYNPTSKDAVVFRYSGTYYGSISSSSTEYLRQIDYAHGTDSVTLDNWNSFANSESSTTNITVDATATYSYDSFGCITNAKDLLAGQRFYYNWVNNSVSKIMHLSTSGVSGQTLSYSYYNGYTDVTSSGNDEAIGTTDDIITRYVFDTFGRCKSVYSSSSDGTEIYGATVGEYENDVKVKNNLKSQAALGGSAVNYILNGSFEKASGSTEFDNWTVSGNVNRIQMKVDGAEGLYSAKFAPTAASPAYISQSLYLPAGTYTLSMQYKTQTASKVQGTVTVSSIAGSGFTHSEAVSMNKDYSTGTSCFFSTTFDVPAYTGGNDRVKVTIKFTASQNQTTAPDILVDRVMLEKNIGNTEYSLVSYGSFDTVGLNSSGAQIPLSSYWSTETGAAPTVATDTQFGNVAKITGNVTSDKYIMQRIYEAEASELSSLRSSASAQDYIVSGFAKSDGAMLPSDSLFELEVKITYYKNGTDRTEVEKFGFVPGYVGWQFTGGAFRTEDVCVKYIDIYCRYSNQIGTAYFDNISVTNVLDESVESYDYYKEGILAGLVKKKSNKFYTEYYEYYDNRNLRRVANNLGEITDYYYTSNNLVNCYIEYDFENEDGRGIYPEDLADPDSAIEKTPKLKTDYVYNAYGLVTQTESYPINDSLSKISGSKRLYHRYVYNTTSGSKIFGALTWEWDELDVDIRYYYDSKDGKLLATVNSDEDTGVCYTYDEMGNLTGVMPATFVGSSAYEEVTDAESVSYTYNDRNLLSTITTESTTYTFTYDVFGNTASVTAGENELAEYTYNQNNGKLNKITYGNGFSVSYVYNVLELLTEVWYNYTDGTSENVYEYEYTADGQVYRFIDNLAGKTTKYKYDVNNRVVGIVEYKNGDAYHTNASQNAYDDQGQLEETYFFQNLSETNAAIQSYSYKYETDGRLKCLDIGTSISIKNLTYGSEEYEYDVYDRVEKQTNSFRLYSGSTTGFTNEIGYTYKTYSDRTSSWVASYTSTVNSGTALTYTYTYDQNGNITKIVYSTGQEIRYVYDDLSQLIREDNGLINKTYVYTYDFAGNITQKQVFALTAAGTTPSSPTSTYNYGYASGWGDRLTSYNGQTIEYDVIGNPTIYYNGSSYNFTWTGRQLTGATKGGVSYSFTYNDEGMRTSKTKNGVTTTYYLEGSRIVAEETNDNLTVYIYDASGMPVGMQYCQNSSTSTAWEVYWFERNLQGDIVAVYSSEGVKLVEYKYDAWGNTTVTYYNSGSSTTATKNPFRYRGYYYDVDLGLYYLQTRYYDSNTGRFISPDKYISTGKRLTGYNMYSYCGNNPIMRVDPTGEAWWCWVLVVAVVAVVVAAVEYNTPDEEEHYSRNELNIEFPDTYDKEDDFFEGWNDTVSANCHQFTAPNRDNKKFVSPDGKYEVIYDANNKRVDDPRDMGTYNFVPSGDSKIGHFIKDVLPWIKYGNSPEDTTTPWQRIWSFMGVYV